MGIAVVEFKIFFMSFEQCLQLQFSFSVKFEIDIDRYYNFVRVPKRSWIHS